MSTSRRLAGTALALGLAAAVAGCGQSGSTPAAGPPAGTHVITDSTGAMVTVPTTISRIADAWPAHNEVVQMLGAGDKIVATVLTPTTTPWLYTVQPALKRSETVFTSTTVSTEKLTQARPDVVFVPTDNQVTAKTTELGLPTAQLNFQDFDDLKKVVATTADVLGPDARAQATAYDGYLDDTLSSVSAVVSPIPADKRPTVLHVNSLDPLVIDGPGSIIDNWITVAGGRDAAEVAGNLRPVSTEQVAQWNPDVIILGANAGGAGRTGAQTLAALAADPFWSTLSAVRNHKVYVDPAGAYLWDRYGVEEALQVRWAAKMLHPDAFPTLDMVAETKSFYSRFLHYDLSDDQARRILAAENPA